LNKKVKRLARLSALYYKSKEDNVLVVEDFSFDMPKTKNMVKVLSALKLQDKKTLFVVNTDPKNFVTLSARNIANVKVMNAASVNAYEVLNAKKLVFSETAIVELDKMCANS
jgi:large subunit ribosomal protein L4